MRSRAVLARNLRRLRHERRINQETLADSAGMGRTYLSNLETERSSATLDKLDALARALGLHASDLIDDRTDRTGSRDRPPERFGR